MTKEIKAYLQSVTKEQLDIDYADAQMEKEAIHMDTMQKWIDFLKGIRDSDVWAYELYSDSLRALWSPYEDSKRPTSLEELQDGCLFEIDYLAKHRDKEAKEFMKTANFDKYAIIESVKNKWYKKYKRV